MSDAVSPPDVPIIYRILESCTNEELKPLVETLLQTPVSILAICRAYARHSPDHARYTDQIGDEIYRLGQKALNIVDGSRPSYDTLVGALIKRLKLPIPAGDTDQGEKALLNVFAKQRLSSVALYQRQAAVNAARTEVSKAASAWLTPEWSPLASCLLQVAYLRACLRDRNIDCIETLDSHRRESTDAATRHSQLAAMTIEAEDGTEVLSLVAVDESGHGGWRKVRSDDVAINGLNTLVSSIPNLAAQGELNAGNYMKVIVPAGTELVRSTKHGSLIGVIKDLGPKGKLVGGAKLKPGNLSGVLTGGLILGIASNALAQKHLADISQKLTDIKAAVDDVSAFQKDGRRSAVVGAIQYFEQIAPSVLAGELDDEVASIIEAREAELLGLENHLVGDIRAQILAIGNLKDEELIGQGKFAKKLEQEQDVLRRLMSELVVCLRARACGWQLLSAFPGREHRKESRLEHLLTSLAALHPAGDIAIAADTLLREKISAISNADARFALLGREDELFSDIARQSGEVAQGLQRLNGKIEDEGGPLEMDLRIENGRVVATRVLARPETARTW